MTRFLVTGASSGLGLELAFAALGQGHSVIGATRNPTKARIAAPDFEKLGGVWLALDVSDPAAELTVKHIVEKEETDVLVNSAAYALLGPVEKISDVEAHAEMETNFHGTLRTIRAALPSFRARRSGTIVNVTSGAGFVGYPSRGLYAGSKFAVEGMSESLAREMAPFGLRVVIVEPGAYRTNFLETLVLPAAGIGGYEGTPAHNMIQMTLGMKDMKLGNVRKAGETLLDVILGTGLAESEEVKKCLRVPLGQDCWPLAKKEAEAWRDELTIIEPISMSVGKED